jgi:heat shock protein HtpX
VFYLVLVFLYFFAMFAFLQGFLFIFPYHYLTTGSLFIWHYPSALITVTVIAIMLAGVHFWFSASGAVEAVMKSLGATPPDPEDGVHRRLKNVVDEIHVVTGRTKKIDCMVIPSLSLNAIAVEDLSGQATIAITEGLLSRLTRPQLEAVLAHESYHILSNDCIEATVATSLFGMYAAMLEKLQDFGDEEKGGGLHPAFFLFWVLMKLGQMLNLFISREREYRADAASVRMTRDPVAMAEALYLLSRNWRSTGLIGSGLEMLCIMNPEEAEVEEEEGFWQNLMSTHPPIRKRIDVLLSMAHADISILKSKDVAGTVAAVTAGKQEDRYFLLDPKNQWQGPYGPGEMTSLSWLSPLTWTRTVYGRNIQRASADALIHDLLAERLSRMTGDVSSFSCPLCRQPLARTTYERTHVYQCKFCGGTLIENDKIPRIIARREEGCTERVKSLAKAVLTDNQKRISLKKLKGNPHNAMPPVNCPKCGHPMFRTFYSLAYLIEIDRCGICSITWFDQDELEMLQCVIENKITPALDV